MDKVALELKEEGNQCFREKRYNKAVQLYTSSLEKQVDPIVLGNRAQAYIQLKHFQHAVMDCNKALEIDPKFVKAIYRRAVALDSLGLFKQAAADAERCLSFVDDSATKALAQRLKNKSDVPSLEVKACEKGDEVRSDLPLVELVIECDGAQEEPQRPSTSQSGKPDAVPMSLPPPPSTFPSFLADFTLLRKNPAHFARYFLQIPPSHFHDLFDDLLDSDAVSCLLQGLAVNLEARNPPLDVLQVTQCLLHLADIGRFDMISMFLSVDDRKSLHMVCGYLAPIDAEAVLSKFSG